MLTPDAIEEARRELPRRQAGRQATIDWRFTTDDAQIKLKRRYPVIHA